MTIEIRTPELEQLVQEEILRGQFDNVDDLLTEALHALREKKTLASAPLRPPRENLAQFLLDSPFAGSDLNLERRQDYGRPVDLSVILSSIPMSFRNSVAALSRLIPQ